MKKTYILFVSLILISCNLNNKNKFQKAEKVIEAYYKTYNTYNDISVFDTLLSANFIKKNKKDFVKNTTLIKDNYGSVVNYKNNRITSLSEGLTLTKIRLEYNVEYEKIKTKEIFELTKDSLNHFKVDAYRVDFIKK